MLFDCFFCHFCPLPPLFAHFGLLLLLFLHFLWPRFDYDRPPLATTFVHFFPTLACFSPLLSTFRNLRFLPQILVIFGCSVGLLAKFSIFEHILATLRPLWFTCLNLGRQKSSGRRQGLHRVRGPPGQSHPPTFETYSPIPLTRLSQTPMGTAVRWLGKEEPRLRI